MSTTNYINLALVLLLVIAASLFATLTYALRDFSRSRLSDSLARRGLGAWAPRTIDNAGELAFVTSSLRLVSNLGVLLGVLHLTRFISLPMWADDLIAAGITAGVTLITSVMIPHALANHAGEPIIALFVRPLGLLRVLLHPLTVALRATENVVQRATRPNEDLEDAKSRCSRKSSPWSKKAKKPASSISPSAS